MDQFQISKKLQLEHLLFIDTGDNEIFILVTLFNFV